MYDQVKTKKSMTSDNIIGKTILIGITYYDEHAKPLEQKQIYGKIIELSQETGIKYLDVETNEELTLPPRPDALFRAPKGQYTEYISKKIITDPDFISIWNVKKQTRNNDNWDWIPCWLDWAEEIKNDDPQ